MLVLESVKHAGMYFIPYEHDDRLRFAKTADFCSEGNIKVYLIFSQAHLVPEGDLELFYSTPNSWYEYIPIMFNARLI